MGCTSAPKFGKLLVSDHYLRKLELQCYQTLGVALLGGCQEINQILCPIGPLLA